MGKISNYARVLVAKLQDVFVVDQTDNNVTTTKSVTVEQIGDAICGEQVHADLETDDQTIIGGINENKDKVGDLSSLTTTNKDSLVDAVNELDSDKADKSALTWTLLGETTGTAEQSLPATWNEIQVYGAFGGNVSFGFVSHAIKAHLGANPTNFIEGGADKDAGTDHHIAIWHLGSNNKIGLKFWRYNNTDYTSTSKLIVYYR